ncbi:ATPase/histidine kinase/DNA gyrase B/HSP90 domain protein [Hoylesella marshii DSM 16973 = JCM 13450]|uniref:Chaperone protein HtpG n=2 Tax=Hoylesella marshii TaxID=189722 RepID=E0NS55_9BACT|nr:ATPase/histidine kinase/DNA gyrase B/HSP90 domain protein [Hoylesella marshii DSM 16973 = JCM 13450]
MITYPFPAPLAYYLFVIWQKFNDEKTNIIMAKGNIGVTTENIFPVIKKFLYSDHEIFLREMVSNAVDATQKMKTLSERGEYKGDLGSLTVSVQLNKEKKTITISDHGLGMTEDEIDKYINQIAFSGVTDFLDKYKDNANAIIGHFGLGFYSAFMVSDRVEIITRSYKEDSKAVKWSCDGSPEYEVEEVDKAERGTDIVLHIADDCKEFLEKERIQALLNKYCRFMAVPIAFGKKTEWKDGKQVETGEDNIINDVAPLWTKAPSTLKDDDYKQFYHTLYPMQDDPLFWIHLNVDYPFHLTGVLYFPRVQSNLDLQRNKIQLYCNQVFVTDQVEGIVPEFLTLLHGVIDSPDIPLNVSRSYLQSDANVKKISSYITKKVADRLNTLFKEDRKDYEKKWDDLKIFINYGMLSQEDFYDRAKEFALFKDTENKFFTFEEYKTLIKDSQTDKDGQLIYLYATNKEEQYSYIEAAKAKGYSVLMLDGQLDVHMVSMLEQKFEKSRFARVDADIIDRLIVKEERHETSLTEEESANLSQTFRSQLPKIEKVEFSVEVQDLGENAQPVLITQNEWMRRMKDISHFQSGMNFYAQMPDAFSLVLNSNHRLVKQVLSDEVAHCSEALKPVLAELKGLNARLAALRQSQKDKKAEEITQEEKDEMAKTEKAVSEETEKKNGIIADYAASNQIVKQLIDLALLQNGMLKGAGLDAFLKRSIDLIK